MERRYSIFLILPLVYGRLKKDLNKDWGALAFHWKRRFCLTSAKGYITRFRGVCFFARGALLN
jgi:hypothetical protein